MDLSGREIMFVAPCAMEPNDTLEVGPEGVVHVDVEGNRTPVETTPEHLNSIRRALSLTNDGKLGAGGIRWNTVPLP